MRPNRLILLAEESVGVEFVGLKRPVLVVFNSCPLHRMMIANRYLREDVVLLNRNKNIVCRYGASGGVTGGGCAADTN